ncbi:MULTISPECIES: stage III sporulation protein AE [Bacillaceae]|uniref:Stage III sporulation protein AE n=1 Tax=Bacillus infantis TaxID=324767 RepID=A0A5D4SW29_9BACI|nr:MULTISPECIES: stage III sporulation protein AE [Bacillus]MCA1036173.1 stage III sporulation protein AE [Bacillus infantis]MCK6204480.1 stage III sporulation protein AE [Bacillus infantis]MCP1159728.1 stage III sporulation protein AE [Bacillus infantis]MDT0159985.1 stage III sporulation protein AE [Bacillus sp. AG4(2022)]MDW2875557.1 stage III sporulation protein AE [Bacillus infantis]
MKQRLPFIFLVLFLATFCVMPDVQASGENEGENGPKGAEALVEAQLETLELDELKGFWEKVSNEYGGFLPESQKGSLYEFIKGDKEFSLKEWMLGGLKFLFHEFLVNGKLLGSLIILTVFSMFLQSLQNSFEKSSVSKAAYSIIFMVLVIIALNSFRVAVDYSIEAISTMTSFILALVPLLLALIASSGGLVSAAFFHPVILFLMNISGLFIQYAVLPLLFLSAVLSIVSVLSENYKVTQLANLLRNWSIGLLGLFVTIFLGVISVQGASAAITDGVTLRTAKFITGNFIPVIGRMFTDATDTVISASVLLKNTVGIAGVAILLIIAAFPAIKILMIAFIYKFAAAVLQPLGGGPVIACLDIISKSVIYVFAALALVSLMFFLSITVIIAAGNLTMMMR